MLNLFGDFLWSDFLADDKGLPLFWRWWFCNRAPSYFDSDYHAIPLYGSESALFCHASINQLECAWTSSTKAVFFFSAFDECIFTLQLCLQQRTYLCICVGTYGMNKGRNSSALQSTVHFFIVEYLVGEWFWPKTFCSWDLWFYGWIVKWLCLKRPKRA